MERGGREGQEKESPPSDHHATGAAEPEVQLVKLLARALIFDSVRRYRRDLSVSKPLLF